MDNAELLVIHRQADPQAADLLAKLAGTDEAWVHSHHVLDGHGRDGESGEHNRRLVDRHRAHSDAIHELHTGEAFVIETRPGHRVRQARVRAVSRVESIPRRTDPA